LEAVLKVRHATLKAPKMERAGRLLGNLASIRKSLSVEELVAAAWPAAVGNRIAAWTSVARMVRKSLIVHVEDANWQQNLFGLRHQILANLAKIVGEGVVDEIQFRIAATAAIPRREPQREQTARSADAEAGGIEDPVLRRVYLTSKRKASK